jgi:hypothetical protein
MLIDKAFKTVDFLSRVLFSVSIFDSSCVVVALTPIATWALRLLWAFSSIIEKRFGRSGSTFWPAYQADFVYPDLAALTKWIR